MSGDLLPDMIALAEREVTALCAPRGEQVIAMARTDSNGDDRAYYNLLCRVLRPPPLPVVPPALAALIARAEAEVTAMYVPIGERLLVEARAIYTDPHIYYCILQRVLRAPKHEQLGLQLLVAAADAGRKVGEA